MKKKLLCLCFASIMLLGTSLNVSAGCNFGQFTWCAHNVYCPTNWPNNDTTMLRRVTGWDKNCNVTSYTDDIEHCNC